MLIEGGREGRACVCVHVRGARPQINQSLLTTTRTPPPNPQTPKPRQPQPFEGGLGSFKLYILLGRYLKYAYRGPAQDSGAVLHVRACVGCVRCDGSD